MAAMPCGLGCCPLNLAKQKLLLDEEKIEAAKRRRDEAGRATQSLKEKLGTTDAAPAPLGWKRSANHSGSCAKLVTAMTVSRIPSAPALVAATSCRTSLGDFLQRARGYATDIRALGGAARPWPTNSARSRRK